MTIFDSIKYPINGNHSLQDLMDILPEDLWNYWYNKYWVSSYPADGCVSKLKELILKYDTDECEVAKYYTI